MKRSEINALVRDATRCFQKAGWTLPPNPRWDVTDFGLGDWQTAGLVLVNLAEEPEYCEKLMYARRGMATPAHCHAVKKEDIVCRWGELSIQVWPTAPDQGGFPFSINVNGAPREVVSGAVLTLSAGERVTLLPGVYHEFRPLSDECVMGEVSTANDDLNDNFFVNPRIGRYAKVEEDEPPIVRLVSDSAPTP
ncbi:MAG: D-lyxose/D-mannose family sugar isomerase [Fimbriimonadaceae bacterium]|nr:D-lyxose/D-mannose family sugar isomerase [Fimbriimonadaceae bacterium]